MTQEVVSRTIRNKEAPEAPAEQAIYLGNLSAFKTCFSPFSGVLRCAAAVSRLVQCIEANEGLF